MATLGMTKEELRGAVARLLAHLGEGMSDAEARDAMGLEQDQFDRLKRKLYELEGDRLRNRPVEEVFIDYAIEQRACLKALDDLGDVFAPGQLAARVGAIRAKSDIVDKIVKFGQDIGLIDKRPEEKRILAGVMVSDMSNKQLRSMITSELSNLNSLIGKYGEQSIMDMDPGSLHYDAKPALPPAKKAGNTGETKAKSKTNKAKANKVHGGRRRVRKRKAEM